MGVPRKFDEPPVKRYSGAPLPPYRFLPGDPTTPHPTEDPRGHSFSTHEHESSTAPVCAGAPDRWHECEMYLHGCDLYNRAYWWEAHESWEDIWKACAKRSAQYAFLQALIQYAAAALKVRQNKPRGLKRLLHTADQHMRTAIDRGAVNVYMGVDLAPWTREVEKYYELRMETDVFQHDPDTFAYIRLLDPPPHADRGGKQSV